METEQEQWRRNYVLLVAVSGSLGVLLGVLQDVQNELSLEVVAWKVARGALCLACVVAVGLAWPPKATRPLEKTPVFFYNRVERSPGLLTAEVPECYVCMTASANAAFGPCGHGDVCLQCASRLPRCPLCRRWVEALVFWR
jgi:hypothetical protein